MIVCWRGDGHIPGVVWEAVHPLPHGPACWEFANQCAWIQHMVAAGARTCMFVGCLNKNPSPAVQVVVYLLDVYAMDVKSKAM